MGFCLYKVFLMADLNNQNEVMQQLMQLL